MAAAVANTIPRYAYSEGRNEQVALWARVVHVLVVEYVR